MTRIAIIGGGISGLTAAYELELARKRGADIDWQLYEASDRLGGIIETTRIPGSEGEYGEWILEGGPEGWVSEKPWARELAIELGLEDELIYSNDATRKTYILRDERLQPIPDGMRLMVPEDLTAIDNSPLFSLAAKAAYASELIRADELKQQAPDQDESVASFVHRHFGDEVLNTLAAPLLSGVFGGDVHKLSVRAVMPQFVVMEREHGSLIAALQFKAAQRTREPQPIFTTLRRGMASFIEALASELPADRLHMNRRAAKVQQRDDWRIWFEEHNSDPSIPIGAIVPPSYWKDRSERCDDLILATDHGSTRLLLSGINTALTTLFPKLENYPSLFPPRASSAILAAFAWPADLARSFTIPPGFGFLVPPPSTDNGQRTAGNAPLLATTFVDQKFLHRAPAGSRILRAFFGGDSADRMSHSNDRRVAQAALTQLRAILGPIPDPVHTHIRRLPRSLPQYEVGHLDRMAELEWLVAGIPGLHLLGNAYHGVGLPDLIRDARRAARTILGAAPS